MPSTFEIAVGFFLFLLIVMVFIAYWIIRNRKITSNVPQELIEGKKEELKVYGNQEENFVEKVERAATTSERINKIKDLQRRIEEQDRELRAATSSVEPVEQRRDIQSRDNRDDSKSVEKPRRSKKRNKPTRFKFEPI